MTALLALLAFKWMTLAIIEKLTARPWDRFAADAGEVTVVVHNQLVDQCHPRYSAALCYSLEQSRKIVLKAKSMPCITREEWRREVPITCTVSLSLKLLFGCNFHSYLGANTS